MDFETYPSLQKYSNNQSVFSTVPSGYSPISTSLDFPNQFAHQSDLHWRTSTPRKSVTDVNPNPPQGHPSIDDVVFKQIIGDGRNANATNMMDSTSLLRGGADPSFVDFCFVPASSASLNLNDNHMMVNNPAMMQSCVAHLQVDVDLNSSSINHRLIGTDVANNINIDASTNADLDAEMPSITTPLAPTSSFHHEYPSLQMKTMTKNTHLSEKNPTYQAMDQSGNLADQMCTNDAFGIDSGALSTSPSSSSDSSSTPLFPIRRQVSSVSSVSVSPSPPSSSTSSPRVNPKKRRTPSPPSMTFSPGTRPMRSLPYLKLEPDNQDNKQQNVPKQTVAGVSCAMNYYITEASEALTCLYSPSNPLHNNQAVNALAGAILNIVQIGVDNPSEPLMKVKTKQAIVGLLHQVISTSTTCVPTVIIPNTGAHGTEAQLSQNQQNVHDINQRPSKRSKTETGCAPFNDHDIKQQQHCMNPIESDPLFAGLSARTGMFSVNSSHDGLDQVKANGKKKKKKKSRSSTGSRARRSRSTSPVNSASSSSSPPPKPLYDRYACPLHEVCPGLYSNDSDLFQNNSICWCGQVLQSEMLLFQQEEEQAASSTSAFALSLAPPTNFQNLRAMRTHILLASGTITFEPMDLVVKLGFRRRRILETSANLINDYNNNNNNNNKTNIDTKNHNNSGMSLLSFPSGRQSTDGLCDPSTGALNPFHSQQHPGGFAQSSALQPSPAVLSLSSSSSSLSSSSSSLQQEDDVKENIEFSRVFLRAYMDKGIESRKTKCPRYVTVKPKDIKTVKIDTSLPGIIIELEFVPIYGSNSQDQSLYHVAQKNNSKDLQHFVGVHQKHQVNWKVYQLAGYSSSTTQPPYLYTVDHQTKYRRS